MVFVLTMQSSQADNRKEKPVVNFQPSHLHNLAISFPLLKNKNCGK